MENDNDNNRMDLAVHKGEGPKVPERNLKRETLLPYTVLSRYV